MDFQDYKLYKGVSVHKYPVKANEISKSECKELLKRGGYIVRQIFDFDCDQETSFWFIVKDSFEDLDSFPKKIQKYIKKANEKFIIGKISRERLCEQGWHVMKTACENYKVKASYPTEEKWHERVDNIDENHEFWDCIDRETDLLQAFAICNVSDDFCEFETSKANPEFLPKYYQMYGMYFARN